MSLKDFSSDINDWVDASREWGYNTPLNGFLNSLLPALESVENVSNELLTLPYDSQVTPAIPSSIPRDTLNEVRIRTLSERRLIMNDFTDSIHYEIAEHIDVPFVQAIDPVINAAYDLNPKSFTSDGKSLEKLITDVIDDKALKNDLKDKFKNLDKDTISKNIKDVIDDANYWAGEFEKAGKIRDIQQEFLDKYMDDWDTMTEEERQNALNAFAMDIGEILGNGNQIIGGIFFYSDEKDTAGGRHVPIMDGDKVGIHEKYTSDTISLRHDLRNVLNTVTHECRHRQQSVESNNLFKSNNKREKEWRSGFLEYIPDALGIEEMDYWRNPIEEDARAFAGLASA